MLPFLVNTIYNSLSAVGKSGLNALRWGLFGFASLAAAQYTYGIAVNGEAALKASNIENSLVATQPALEEYNKIFYSYSAPEQEFEDIDIEEQMKKAVKKNVRVIFIKSPENTALEKAALQLATNTANDYTAIYVLSKQSDIGSLATQLQEIKSKNVNRPEVHFVKYRTEADAENAQRAIQAQYSNTPGTSNNNGHDTASVINFASKSVPQSTGSNSNVKTPAVSRTRTTASPRSASRNSYLPPGIRL